MFNGAKRLAHAVSLSHSLRVENYLRPGECGALGELVIRTHKERTRTKNRDPDGDDGPRSSSQVGMICPQFLRRDFTCGPLPGIGPVFLENAMPNFLTQLSPPGSAGKATGCLKARRGG